MIALNLMTLEDRRIRGDIIETFKIIKGFTNIDSTQFFNVQASDRLRGHSLKLTKPRCNTQLRQHFFSQRVIQRWNNLPQYVINADSVNEFKNKLDDYYKKHGFGSTNSTI